MSVVNTGPASLVGLAFFLMALVFVVFGIFGTVFWVWMLVDAATREPEGDSKLTWILVIALTHWVGAAIYYFVRRPQRLAETGR